MPADGVPLTAPASLLSQQEIVRLAGLFVSLGVRKVRLTGGEPSIRSDLISTVTQLNELKCASGSADVAGLHSIGITSNGLVLGRKLRDLKLAGLDSVNVSLDTLDPLKFPIITRRHGFERVLECIDRAIDLGFGGGVKVNCVVMRGVNDEECLDFVEFARDRDVTVRFIEYMPFDGNLWQNKKMVPYFEIVDRIRNAYGSANVKNIPGDNSDTAKVFQIHGFRGKVGFITSMSNHFCGGCNRLRITADGNLKVY